MGTMVGVAVAAGFVWRMRAGRLLAVRVRRGPPRIALRPGGLDVGIPRFRR